MGEQDIEGIELTKFLNERFSKPINDLTITKSPVATQDVLKMNIPCSSIVYEVHNPSMFAAYILRKKEYQIKGDFLTKNLYHATPACNVDSIFMHNLDYRKNFRYRYGTGVCFSPRFQYAYHCTHRKSLRICFLSCEVLIGKVVKRDLRYDPSISIDTGIGNGDDVYVKARDDEFIPKLLIELKI